MKLNLPSVEDTAQLKYRVPVSIKAELDALAEQCRKQKLDFGSALSEGLRGVTKAIRDQLEPKPGSSLTPNTGARRWYLHGARIVHQ